MATSHSPQGGADEREKATLGLETMDPGLSFPSLAVHGSRTMWIIDAAANHGSSHCS